MIDTTTLEKKITRLLITAKHIQMHGVDPLLTEDFEDQLYELKIKYGQYLNDILFDIYDEYCEDDDCPDIIEFLTSDKVAVHPDELFLSDAFLEMKTNPLRIELSGNNDQFHEVLWKVA